MKGHKTRADAAYTEELRMQAATTVNIRQENTLVGNGRRAHRNTEIHLKGISCRNVDWITGRV
jgi:hypothetical protein